ncbi:MAG: hypothetical protein ACYSVY_08975, partial [Planctomycetota bacterium]
MARIFKPRYPKLRTVRGADGKPLTEERVAKSGKYKGEVRRIPRREPVLDRSGRPVYERARKYYIEYTDAQGVVRQVAGYTDKRATDQKAAELERQAAREQAGVIDGTARHAQQLLADHVNDWHRTLLDKGTTQSYADLSKNRVLAVLRGAKAAFWRDLDPN